MDKLTIATQVLLKLIETDKTGFDAEGIAAYSFEIADAMQAEADKRNKAEAEQKRKEMREMLNAPNTFVEREGHHFDDVEEWQPDWSQAPGRMNWFSIDKDGTAAWYVNKPTISATEWVVDFSDRCSDCYMYTSNFGYTGNWKYSLRERPHGF